VRDILRAGTDVDCGGFIGNNAQAALTAGTIVEADIDERLAMLFRVRLRLGHFDPLNPLDEISADEICSEQTIATSMDGARQGTTMLKNVGKTLPLSPSSGIVVLGPNANLSESDTGYYGPHNCCASTQYLNLVNAVAKYAGAAVVSDSVIPGVKSEDMSGIPAAVSLAQKAETVILAVGTDLGWSAEGHDATNISFTDAQLAMVEQCAAAAKNPVIVVICTATPLDISSMLANPKVRPAPMRMACFSGRGGGHSPSLQAPTTTHPPTLARSLTRSPFPVLLAQIGAIIHTGQPSVTIYGIAEILYGKVSPAGRTIQTIYPATYQDQISIFDFGMRPGASPFVRPDCTESCAPNPASPWEPRMHGGPCGSCAMGTNPGRTHRFYVDKPVVPFGFGLSYTTFTYSVAAAPTGAVSLDAVRDMLAATKAAGRTFPSLELLGDAAKLVQYSINVTNTGTMDSDDAVLGFLTPPGAGVNGVPLQSLYAFDRVHVPAGKTVTVVLYPSLTEFTQVDSAGNRHVHPGDYTFTFGVEETAEHGMGYVQHTITTY
jgi:beta-D-xylosidase 4